MGFGIASERCWLIWCKTDSHGVSEGSWWSKWWPAWLHAHHTLSLCRVIIQPLPGDTVGGFSANSQHLQSSIIYWWKIRDEPLPACCIRSRLHSSFCMTGMHKVLSVTAGFWWAEVNVYRLFTAHSEELSNTTADPWCPLSLSHVSLTSAKDIWPIILDHFGLWGEITRWNAACSPGVDFVAPGLFAKPKSRRRHASLGAQVASFNCSIKM